MPLYILAISSEQKDPGCFLFYSTFNNCYCFSSLYAGFYTNFYYWFYELDRDEGRLDRDDGWM